MKGGYRVGSGRPRGSKNGVRKPTPIRSNYQSVADTAVEADALEADAVEAVATPTPPGNYISGLEWLRMTVNDVNADLARRDRAAQVLAAIEARKSVALGKKEQAEQAAQWAGSEPIGGNCCIATATIRRRIRHPTT